jgi:hypothetical protein
MVSGVLLMAKAKKKKKKKRARTRRPKQCAVFTYDVFPYMVVHDVLSVDDDGDIEFCQGYYRTAGSLIAIFPHKKREEIDDMLDNMKTQYEIAKENARKRLLQELAKRFPALQAECESHYEK